MSEDLSARTPDAISHRLARLGKPNSAAAPMEFLKAVKRAGAALFPVGGRLELRGGGNPSLHSEFQRHRVALERMVGAERLGGITVETVDSNCGNTY